MSAPPSGTPTTRVGLLGAYGTGTNWAQATLRKSGVPRYETAGVAPGSGQLIRQLFKHYVIEADTVSILEPPADVLFLCLVKSPLFWILSIARMLAADVMPHPMRELMGMELSQMIRAPATMVSARRELGGDAFVHAANLPDLWNQYARGYLHYLPQERVHLMPYEVAARAPTSAFHALLDRVGRDRASLVIHTERRMGIGHDLQGAQAYYRDDRNRLTPFAKSDIDFVDANIDHRLLAAIGYLPDGSI